MDWNEEQLAGLSAAADVRGEPEPTDEKRAVPPEFFGVPDGSAGRLPAAGNGAVEHRGHDAAGRRVMHKGASADCARCRLDEAVEANEQLKSVALELRDERIAAGDVGQYYAVSARHGTLMSREGRPLYATLAEWQSIEAAAPTQAYIPITYTGDRLPRRIDPLFGSLPLFNMSEVPDVVGRLVELLSFLEKAAGMFGDRVERVGQVAESASAGLENLSLIVTQRIHFVELLDRAAQLIDPDAPAATYEQRLDWLAKWRETVGR